MAFGALLIQQTYDYSDEETVQQIQENPYLQFFVGRPGYQDTAPFEASSMVHFRKRLTEERLMAINDTILAHHEKENDESTDDDDDNDDDTGSKAGRHDPTEDASNQGT